MSSLKIGRNEYDGYRVELDGRSIEDSVTDLTLVLRPFRPAQVELSLRQEEADVALDEVEVVLPEQTRQLLIELGWTPPAQDDEEED